VSRRRNLVWRIAALLLITAAGMSCADTKSGPNTPLSIQFDPPQLPSMIKSDVLHDTLGNVDSLHAVIFNSAGDSISGAPVRYVHADTSTIITIDPVSGHVTATDTGVARVVAQTTGLQSPFDTIFVVSTPDLFANITRLDTALKYSGGLTDTLLALSVKLTSATIPVDHWRVEYRFIYPADLNSPDSNRVLLSDDSRHFSLVDTTSTDITGQDGAATRFVRISPFAHTFDDSVVIEARAFFPNHTVVPGSPVRFKVLVTIP
jgi:hypothetical protein